MENDPLSLWVILTSVNITYFPITITSSIVLLICVVLLFCSALISGSEVAFFSLSPHELKNIKNSKNRVLIAAANLTKKPKMLLATILVANNFINIAIVILSTFIVNSHFNFGESPVFGFIVQVILITFLILLFGEIIPKIYATQHSFKMVQLMALPLLFLSKFFKPITNPLMVSTRIIDKRIRKKSTLSKDDLTNAIELTSEVLPEEKGILKGIIEFGNTQVSEIMCSRVDVQAFNITLDFTTVLHEITKAGYSRIPVYAKSFDDIKGILYIKDLLPHIQKSSSFHWQSLIRRPYFVPENKKINELLEELQTDKIHMAIVVDEYGGVSGIVTMEDIIEEIVGDISDEFDDDDINFSKINDNNFLFEGKTLLNDFYKITETENDTFDEVKGEAETLAGLILEIKGEFPNLYDKIIFNQFTFTIEALDKRRIVKIKTTIKR